MLSFTPARGRKHSVYVYPITSSLSVIIHPRKGTETVSNETVPKISLRQGYHSPPQGDGNTIKHGFLQDVEQLSFTPARGRKLFTIPDIAGHRVPVIIHPRKGTETGKLLGIYAATTGLSFTPARGRKRSLTGSRASKTSCYHSPPQGDGNR